jgi:hypothetical protein
MEEESISALGQALGYAAGRHNLHEWIFLFGFFVLCRLRIGKSEDIGNLFLLIYGNDEENILQTLIQGFVGLHFATVFLSLIICFIFLIVRLISDAANYIIMPLNLVDLCIECSFIWAIISTGFSNAKAKAEYAKEKKEYIDEISYLRDQLRATHLR